MKPRHDLTKGSPIAHRPGLELDALRHRWVRMGAAASSPPRVLREVPRAEVEEHWRQLYAAGKHRGEQTAPSFGHDDHQTWVEVEAGDAHVDPVWRQNLEDTGEIGEAHLKRAEDYAARPGALPPGIALFGAFAARRGRRTLYVRDGNHRALAAHLRGEPGRYYMPRADFDRWQRVTQQDALQKSSAEATENHATVPTLDRVDLPSWARTVAMWLTGQRSPSGPRAAAVQVRKLTDDDLSVALFTDTREYSIVARRVPDGGYLGCTMRMRMAHPGETWQRGADLPDGPLNEVTMQAILQAIVFVEMLPVRGQIGALQKAATSTTAKTKLPHWARDLQFERYQRVTHGIMPAWAAPLRRWMHLPPDGALAKATRATMADTPLQPWAHTFQVVWMAPSDGGAPDLRMQLEVLHQDAQRFLLRGVDADGAWLLIGARADAQGRPTFLGGVKFMSSDAEKGWWWPLAVGMWSRVTLQSILQAALACQLVSPGQRVAMQPEPIVGSLMWLALGEDVLMPILGRAGRAQLSKALFDAPSLRALSERHLRGELLVGGAADGMDPASFDPAALAEGVLHEREHTGDDRIALEIAMDHLAEDPAYYSKLRRLEKAGKWGGPLWPVDDDLGAEGYEYGIIGEVDTGERKTRAWGLKPNQYEVREGGDGPQVFLINDALGDVDGFTGRHLQDLFRRVPERGSRVHLVGSRPMSKAGKPRHEPQAPAGYTPVPGSTAGLYHKREGDHYVYWHPNGSRSGNLAEPTTPAGKGRRLGYLLEHHRDTYLSALHASEGTVYNPKAPQYTPNNDLASVVRDHETAKHPEYVAKLWAHLPAEHRVHAPSDLQRDQERAEDLHRLGRSDSEDELRERVRYANWDLVHGALADPAHPDHQEARDWVQERWGEARGIHPVILASLKRAKSKPGRATLSAQDKALDKLHPAAVAEGFHDWVTQEHPEHADRARTDPATRRDLTQQFLTDRHDITVRDDGRAEFDRLSGAVRRILGDHPVVVNHHTSSSLRARVRREGLHNRGKVVNPHLNSSAGVYVTTQASGPAVDGYHRNAVATHRGSPYTFEVETTIPELEHDPDDSDLRELRGRQFVLPHVPPERILSKASGAQLLHLLVKASGHQLGLFGAASRAGPATATHQVQAHVRHSPKGGAVVVHAHQAHHRPAAAPPATPGAITLTARDVFRMRRAELDALLQAHPTDRQVAELVRAELARRAAKRGQEPSPPPLPSITDAPPPDALQVSAVQPAVQPPAVEEEPATARARAFKAWFADSKVTAADGQAAEQQGPFNTALVVYHGTPVGGFRAFDPAFDKGSNIYGRGFYFTEDREIAEEYTKKDEDVAAGSARGFLDGDGKPVLRLTAAQADKLMRSQGYARGEGMTAWTDDPQAYKDAPLPAGTRYAARNDYWCPNMLHAIKVAGTADGSVDLVHFWNEFRQPTNADFGARRGPKREVEEQFRAIIANEILRALGPNTQPDLPKPQVYDVYLSLQNPIDMSAPADPAAVKRLAQWLAREQIVREVPRLQREQAVNDQRLAEAMDDRPLWHGDTIEAARERNQEERQRRLENATRLKNKLQQLTTVQAQLDAGQEVEHAVEVDDVIAHRHAAHFKDRNLLPIDHAQLLAHKQRLVDESRGRTYNGRQVLGQFHISERNTLTWGDVQYMMTSFHKFDEYKDRFRAWAESEGHDGIRHQGGWNIGTKPHTVWIAWRPEAIKATTAERFDATTKDMFKAGGRTTCA